MSAHTAVGALSVFLEPTGSGSPGDSRANRVGRKRAVGAQQLAATSVLPRALQPARDRPPASHLLEFEIAALVGNSREMNRPQHLVPRPFHFIETLGASAPHSASSGMSAESSGSVTPSRKLASCRA